MSRWVELEGEYVNLDLVRQVTIVDMDSHNRVDLYFGDERRPHELEQRFAFIDQARNYLHWLLGVNPLEIKGVNEWRCLDTVYVNLACVKRIKVIEMSGFYRVCLYYVNSEAYHIAEHVFLTREGAMRYVHEILDTPVMPKGGVEMSSRPKPQAERPVEEKKSVKDTIVDSLNSIVKSLKDM